MMLKKLITEKKIIITIGDHGSVIILHNKKDIEQTIFCQKLDEEQKTTLQEFFTKNQAASIEIMLDTIDQSYKKKNYPFVRKYDLVQIIKREISSDPDKESLKNHIILNNGKFPKNMPAINKKWECILISSSKSDTVNNWIDFISEMPNHINGIYMLPVEMFFAFKKLKPNIPNSDKKNGIYCILLQNKVCGVRQVVFSDGGIIFTRIVNYTFSEVDFLEKYEKDITSTFEYLKRLFPELQIRDLKIINIFPFEALKKLEKITNIDLHFTNYTPFQFASTIDCHNAVNNDALYCDEIISKSFANNTKKILKFNTPKLINFEKLFLFIKSSYYFNLLSLVSIGFASVFSIYLTKNFQDNILNIKAKKLTSLQELNRIKHSTLDGEILDSAQGGAETNIERILDVGKIYEAINFLSNKSVSETYDKLHFIKEYNTSLKSFSYTIQPFNYETLGTKASYKITLSGEILNPNGDVENLFNEFDGLTAEFKKNFGQQKITYPQLPKNIDFAKKYYDFPINFTIIEN